MAASLAAGMKVSSLDLSGKGLLTFSIYDQSVQPAKGATVSIKPDVGTKVGYKKDGMPDVSLSGIEDGTGAFIGNLPAGTYQVTAKDKAGKSCVILLGHFDQNQYVAKAVVGAGELHHLHFWCL